MPTGYTAAIADGITFQQFALSCARAFGATISMRDEPADAPIPDEFPPTNYHLNALATSRQQIERLKALTAAEADVRALETANLYAEARRNSIAEREALRAKYEAMLQQVEAWEPPSNDHVQFKNFMLSQIKDSINVDCSNYHLSPIVQLTGQQWRAQQIADFEQTITYHEKAHAEEVERCRARSEWVQKLKASLVPQEAA